MTSKAVGVSDGRVADQSASTRDEPAGRIWRRVSRRFRRDRAGMIGLAFLIFLLAVAILAPLLAPSDPNQQDFLNSYQGSSSAHLLGTDELGRDVLSRMIYATRTSLLAVTVAMTVAIGVGVPLGLAVGYVGGWLDRVVMRMTDMMFALPALVLVMLVIAILGPGLWSSMTAIGLVFSTGFIRITRNAVLAVREESFITAGKVVGLSTPTLIRRHVLPNALGPIVVQAAMQAGIVLILEASLSFIGLGIQPPDASWGTMLATAADNIQAANSMLIVWPGLAITATVLAMNLVGDGLLDALQPRRTRRRRRPRRRTLTATPAPAVEAVAAPSPGALLAVRGLSIEIGRDTGPPVQVVSDLALDLRAGEVVGLVGESGCGKTTVALALLGLLDDQRQVTGGSIRFDGEELNGRDEAAWRQVRGNEIAMIFQNPVASLNPSLTVGAQVAWPLRRRDGLGGSAARRAAIDLLDRVGVPDAARRARQYPHQFSGGMAQRAMIAMALAARPRVLVADEPVTALDVSVREQVIDLLLDLRDEYGMAILLVTHDLGVVADACDRTVVLYAGEEVENASTEVVFADARHPYTRGLLEARPSRSAADHLVTIPGSVPAPGYWPGGCRFEPRCPFAQAACAVAPVELRTIVDDHSARCLRAQEAPWL